jgi:hypothetical protein
MSQNESEDKMSSQNNPGKNKKRNVFLKMLGFFRKSEQESEDSSSEQEPPGQQNISQSAQAIPDKNTPEGRDYTWTGHEESTRESREALKTNLLISKSENVEELAEKAEKLADSVENQEIAAEKLADSVESREKLADSAEELAEEVESREIAAEAVEKLADSVESREKLADSAEELADSVESGEIAAEEVEELADSVESREIAAEEVEELALVRRSTDVESLKESSEPKHAPDIMANLKDLPGSYKSNRARLIMVDPERLFLNWNFASSQALQSALVFRFRQHFFGQAVVQEIVPVPAHSSGTYYLQSAPGSTFDVQFGTLTKNQFTELFTSNLIQTPSVRPRYSRAPVWKVREDIPAKADAMDEPAQSVWVDSVQSGTHGEAALVAASVIEPHIEAHAAVWTSAKPVAVMAGSRYQAPSAAPTSQKSAYQWVETTPPPSFKEPELAVPTVAGPTAEETSARDFILNHDGPEDDSSVDPVLPSVRWIGSSEFLLIPGGPESSFGRHVGASAGAVRRG